MPVSITRRGTVIIFAVSLILTTIGCTTFTDKLQSANDALPWNAKSARVRKLDSTAVRIAAVWTHDIVNVPGNKPVQGFGGRIYFYNHEQKAIQVNGELVVFTFDDTDASQRGAPNRNPDRKFVFRADQLQSHLTDSELGPSYSFWIPWQEFGGEQQLISLVPVFMPTKGRNVTGHFSKTSLPGKHKSVPVTQPQDQFATPTRANQGLRSDTISRGYYQKNLSSSVQTTTFAVPHNLTRHLASSAAAPGHFRSPPPTVAQPDSKPPTTVRQLSENQSHTSQPYRSLTSSSGLKAIKVLPPGPTRNATRQ